MKSALQRLIDGPDEDCQRGAVEQHFCQDRGNCACMDEIVPAVAARVAELEAALRKINARIDSPARFNAEVQAVLDSVIDTSDTKFKD